MHAFSTPSGRVYVRYEPPHGRKVILRSEFDTEEFYAELAAAKGGKTLPRPKAIKLTKDDTSRGNGGTWRWLCEQYFASSRFKHLFVRDQRVRRNVLQRTWEEPLLRDNPTGLKFADLPLAKFGHKAITILKERAARLGVVPDEMYPDDRSKDREKPTAPEAGNSVVRYVRATFEWTKDELDADLIGGHNWAHDIKLYPSSATGWKTWGPEQCAAFEQAHPQGTKARLIYELAKLSGQRKSDVARIEPRHDQQRSQGPRTLDVHPNEKSERAARNRICARDPKVAGSVGRRHGQAMCWAQRPTSPKRTVKNTRRALLGTCLVNTASRLDWSATQCMA